MHEKHTITVTFIVCDGMDSKVKDEIRDLLEHIKTKSLDHAWNVRTVVNHEPATQQDLLH